LCVIRFTLKIKEKEKMRVEVGEIATSLKRYNVQCQTV